MIICLTLLNQKYRKDVEGLRISLKYPNLSVLVFISIVFHSKKRYNISKTDIFDLECHYKKIIDEDYDDEKIFVMNIVGEASLKIEEMVGFFASQIIIAS